ncbi:MAG: TonB-dependent receptor [Acidobacteria bacterium]|nr:TonB-dependent receptor [Acidobacteriota bacterium]
MYIPFVRLAGALVLCAAAVWSQESRAIISGTVTDPQGAVVPAATLEVKNLETNVVSMAITNDRGIYSAPPVNPGRYSVTVSATGFKTLVQRNVELRVADRLALDFKLEIGGTTETVTISTETPLLETQTASQGTVLSKELVAAIPTRGRNVFDLAQMTAGVTGRVQSTFGLRPFDNGENGVRINGGPANTNEVLLDGAPNTQRESGAPANVTIVPPPEAVGEVRIQTNLYDAEYGRTGGGVMSVNLRSGTNTYHGAAWWFVRNDILNANTFESNAAGGAKTSYRLHEPGITFSGPVFIPKVYNGRDKSFFMYTLDIFRDVRPSPTSMVVPSDLQKAGDFSQTYVSGLGGAVVSIYDPLTTVQSGTAYTRTPFPGSRIPGSRINPIAAKINTVQLQPNLGAVPRGQPNLLVTPNPDLEPYNAHVLRFDQTLNLNHKFFVNFSRTNRHQTNGLGLGLANYLQTGHPEASTSYTHWRINHLATFNLTSTLSPTVVSTARISWNRHQFAIHPYSFGYDPTALGFAPSLVAQAQAKSFPVVNIGGFSALGRAGDTLNFSDTWSIGESLTKVKGNHNVKIGGDARTMFNNQSNPAGFATFSFAVNETRANPQVASTAQGDGLASMLLGYPNSLSNTYNNQAAQGQRYYSLFIHDDWRITQRLTLNLGLRWDYESPVSDRFDRLVGGFDTTTSTRLGVNGPAVRGGLLFANKDDRLPYKRDLNNFGPRAGYAYRLSTKMVVRGGWGITYAPTADVAPSTGFSYTTAPSASVANAGILPITAPGCNGASCGMLSNAFPDGILGPPGRSLGLLTNVGQGVSYIYPDRSQPYVHSFSSGVQYELPFRAVIEASYSASRTRSLSTSRNMNSITAEQYRANGSALTGTTVPNPFAGLLPGTSLNGATRTLQQSLLPYPQFTGVTETNRSIGSARYDALLIRLEKRLSAGLTTLFTATLTDSTQRTAYQLNGMDPIGEFIVRDGGTPPWQYNLSSTYDLPFFKDSKGLRRSMLGGWIASGIVSWFPGGIVNVAGANSTGIDPALPDPSYRRWFNTCTLNNNTGARQSCASPTEEVAWVIQRPFTLVTTPNPEWSSVRVRVPAEFNFSLFKSFRIRESLRTEFRAEAFNAFNSPRFGGPTNSATSSQFGVVTLAQANAPRSIQLSLRVSF